MIDIYVHGYTLYKIWLYIFLDYTEVTVYDYINVRQNMSDHFKFVSSYLGK